MQEKTQSEYVSLDKKTIMEVSGRDTVEYEVIASPTQIIHLRTRVERISEGKFTDSVGNLIFTLFAEKKADNIRHQ